MALNKLGKYEIRGMIGRGAVGVVYEAWDPMMARTVAIKALPLLDLDEDGREQYARFKREAQAAARLHHPNIVSAFDYGETETSAYIVMEFLQGQSLKALLARREPLPLDRIGTIMHGLLTGLQHSHSRGVVHRDIKPANIMFSAEGEVKITDFGIAHLDSSGMTRAGSVLGTPAYMAPEQVLGEPVDARTDLFSAGVVLYEMLTGRRPFEGSTSSIMHKIVHLHPPQPSHLAATVSAGIDAVIARALAKAPEERYPSASAFDAAFQAELQRTPDPAAARHADAAGESETTLALPRVLPLAAGPVEPSFPDAAPMPAIASTRSGRGRWVVLLASTGIVAIAATAWLALAPDRAHQSRASREIQSAAGEAGPASQSAPVQAASSSTSGSAATHPRVAEVPAPTTTAVKPTASINGMPGTPPAAAVPASNAAAGSPPATKPAADPLQPVREQVQAIAASAPCSVITADIPSADKIHLRGVSALGEASELEVRASLQRAIGAAVPDAAVSWSMQRVDGPYCPVLDLLRSLPQTPGGTHIALSLPGDRTQLTEGDDVQIAVSSSPATVQPSLDLFTGDGSVRHLHAASTDESHAKATVLLRPGKPYGDQLLAALATAAPASEGRPSQEPAAAYLNFLQSVLKQAEDRHSALAASVLPVIVTAQ